MKALLRRGLAYENLERYRSALEDIRNVLAINPSIEMANAAQVGRDRRWLGRSIVLETLLED